MRYYIKEIHACEHCPNFESEFVVYGPNSPKVKNYCYKIQKIITDSGIIHPECKLPSKLSDWEELRDWERY